MIRRSDARKLTLVLALVIGVTLAGSFRALGAEPRAEPVLHIETGQHHADINRLAVDSASRYLVSGSDDKTVRIWDLASGRLLRVLRPPLGSGNEGKIYAVAMSPDGETIACAGWTGYEWDKAISIYLFARGTGAMVRRITGLQDVVLHLAWSADGRLLAAGLGRKGGVRVYRVQDGTQTGIDAAYGDSSRSVDFDRGDKLVSTSADGLLRLYRVGDNGLTMIRNQRGPGGKRPFSARFSPDGSRIAVGYDDSARVDVVSGDDLRLLYSPDTTGINSPNLGSVAWSADGRQLYAGGLYHANEVRMIRTWAEAGRGPFTNLTAAHNSILDVVPRRAGGIVYSTADAVLGAFDGSNRRILDQPPALVDFRGNSDGFKVSLDGASVLFGLEVRGKSPARFTVSDRRLLLDPPSDASLAKTSTAAPGLDLRSWRHSERPTLNGQPLTLESGETSREVAIAPDRQSLVLGGDWWLRRFDTRGKLLWKVSIPGVAWSVNVSGNGKLVVAALGDGTVRWYRLADGVELLALFPHADKKRWVVWSPSGYYDASPGAEDLIGWHVNRSKDAAADFYPVSRFRATFYRPDVVAKILESLDERTALRLANEDAGRKTQIVDVARSLPPVVRILAPADGTAASMPQVRVRFAVQTAADAPITGLRARVNGQAVPLGDAGNITGGAIADAVRDLAIPIPPQDSEIMLFAENRHGVSVPAHVSVVWRGPPPAAPGPSTTSDDFSVKPKLYVLAVGVSTYQDRTLKLNYPAKDARDFAQAMLAQKARLYRDVEVKVLADAQATKDEVLDGLEWLQRQVTSRDVGMLFLAGHGVNDPNGIYYYLPANADVDRLKRTGVPFSDIKNTLAALAGKAVFFVDTCHSGNVMGTARRGAGDITAVVNELASAENGVVVFAASTGRQYSLESDDWKNGAFTKALVEGVSGKADLRGTGRITHKMLDYYLAERVKELTKGQQTPVNTSPHGVPDFPIALVK